MTWRRKRIAEWPANRQWRRNERIARRKAAREKGIKTYRRPFGGPMLTVREWLDKMIEFKARTPMESIRRLLTPRCAVCDARVRSTSRVGVLRCQSCGREYVRGEGGKLLPSVPFDARPAD